MARYTRYFVTFSRVWDGIADSEGEAVAKALEELKIGSCDQIEIVKAHQQAPSWLRDH